MGVCHRILVRSRDRLYDCEWVCVSHINIALAFRISINKNKICVA